MIDFFMIKQKDIKFSRHAKRRMQLYGISKEDVLNVLRNGRKETSEDGKIFFRHDINKKFKYPVKVITVQRETKRLLLSAPIH